MKKYNLFTLFISIFGFAQETIIPIAGLNYQVGIMKNDSINAKNQRYNAFINLPILNKPNDKLALRLEFERFTISDVEPIFNQNVKGVDASLAWNHKLESRNSLTFFFQYGLYSDFETVSLKDTRFRLGGSYFIKHSDRLKTGWGISYAYQFFGHQINPFIVVDYNISPKLKLSGLFPIRPKLTYQINKNFSWTNELSGNVENYRFSESENPFFLEISGWKVMSNLDCTIAKHHRLSLGFGYILRQNTKVFESAERSDWKIFTFDISKKNEPISEVSTRGLMWNIGYSFVL